ncbi:MAG: hypothetical protein QOJ89_4242 [bacterium]
MKRISIVLVALLLGLSAPAIAPAQFAPTDVPAPLTQPDDSQNSKPFDEDTGLSTLQLVLMFGAAIAIVALIAWVIMRDAHRAAPASERGRAPAAAGAGAGGASKKIAREREREKARKRNKAKAARNQRKRNRPH